MKTKKITMGQNLPNRAQLDEIIKKSRELQEFCEV
jgi:hypothetical protein